MLEIKDLLSEHIKKSLQKNEVIDKNFYLNLIDKNNSDFLNDYNLEINDVNGFLASYVGAGAKWSGFIGDSITLLENSIEETVSFFKNNQHKIFQLSGEVATKIEDFFVKNLSDDAKGKIDDYITKTTDVYGKTTTFISGAAIALALPDYLLKIKAPFDSIDHGVWPTETEFRDLILGAVSLLAFNVDKKVGAWIGAINVLLTIYEYALPDFLRTDAEEDVNHLFDMIEESTELTQKSEIFREIILFMKAEVYTNKEAYSEDLVESLLDLDIKKIIFIESEYKKEVQLIKENLINLETAMNEQSANGQKYYDEENAQKIALMLRNEFSTLAHEFKMDVFNNADLPEDVLSEFGVSFFENKLMNDFENYWKTNSFVEYEIRVPEIKDVVENVLEPINKEEEIFLKKFFKDNKQAIIDRMKALNFDYSDLISDNIFLSDSFDLDFYYNSIFENIINFIRSSDEDFHDRELKIIENILKEDSNEYISLVHLFNTEENFTEDNLSNFNDFKKLFEDFNSDVESAINIDNLFKDFEFDYNITNSGNKGILRESIINKAEEFGVFQNEYDSFKSDFISKLETKINNIETNTVEDNIENGYLENIKNNLSYYVDDLQNQDYTQRVKNAISDIEADFVDFSKKFINQTLTQEMIKEENIAIESLYDNSLFNILETIEGTIVSNILNELKKASLFEKNNLLKNLKNIINSQEYNDLIESTALETFLKNGLDIIYEHFNEKLIDLEYNRGLEKDALRADLNDDNVFDLNDPVLVYKGEYLEAEDIDPRLDYITHETLKKFAKQDEDSGILWGNNGQNNNYHFKNIYLWDDINNDGEVTRNELTGLKPSEKPEDQENTETGTSLIPTFDFDYINAIHLKMGKGEEVVNLGSKNGDDIDDLPPLKPIEDVIEEIIRIRRRDPLTLDLNGDGIQTISVDDGVEFDHDGDGFAENTGWVSKEDGLLVRDLNDNGKIDSGRELFGDNTVIGFNENGNEQIAEDGFQSLAEHDSNNDGVINSEDDIWSELKIWQDSNSDGVSQSYELLDMDDAGVAEINLEHTDTNSNAGHGNTFGAVGSFTTTWGEERDIANLNFQTNDSEGHFNSEISVSEDVSVLANTHQMGLARDLHESMMLSDDLKALVETYSITSSKNERSVLLDKILFSWASTSNFDDYYDRYKNTNSSSFGIPNGEDITQFDKLAVAEIFSGKMISRFRPTDIGNSDFTAVNDFYSDLKEYLFKAISYNDVVKNYGTIMNSIDNNEYTIDSLKTMLSSMDQEEAAKTAFELKIFYSETLNDFDFVDFITNEIYAEEQITHEVAELLEEFGVIIMDENQTDFSLANNFIDTIDFISPENEENITRDDLTILGNELDNNITGSSYNDTLNGGNGDDFIDGGYGQDTLIGGEGNDTLKSHVNGHTSSSSYYKKDTGSTFEGGKGDDIIHDTNHSDTIIYNLGDGHDTLNLSSLRENYWNNEEYSQSRDVIQFGEGISKEDLSFEITGDTLVIFIAKGTENEGSLTINRWFQYQNSNSGYKIEEFQFNDGTTASWQEITEFAVSSHNTGSENDDIIVGEAGFENHIQGHDGDDKLTGNYLNDTIEGGKGDDFIDGSYGQDTLIGGEGNDTLKSHVNGHTSSSSYYKKDTGSTFEGGKGDDIIHDTNHSDTIIYNLGDGHDTLNLSSLKENNWNNEEYTQSRDVIQFGEGISLDDLSYEITGNTLVIIIANGTEDEGSLTIDRWFSYQNQHSGYKIEEFQFNDGTTASWQDITEAAVVSNNIGSENDDIISGMSGLKIIFKGLTVMINLLVTLKMILLMVVKTMILLMVIQVMIF